MSPYRWDYKVTGMAKVSAGVSTPTVGSSAKKNNQPL